MEKLVELVFTVIKEEEESDRKQEKAFQEGVVGICMDSLKDFFWGRSYRFEGELVIWV